MHLEKLRTDYERLLGELELEYYLTTSGQKDEANTAAIYDRYPELCTPEVLEEIREAFETAEGDDLRRLRELRRLAVDILSSQKVKDLEDELMNKEARAEVELPEGRKPYRLSFVELVNESDRSRRRTIHEAQLGVRQSLNPLRERRLGLYHAFFVGMGYSSYTEAMEDLTGLDLQGLRSTVQCFLEDTARLFERWFGYYLERRLGFGTDAVQYYDTGYLFRARDFDDAFPAESLVATVEGFVDALGIDIRAGGNIRFDLEKRPKKSPRAFCSAIVVPTDVVLTIMPKGGYDDWRAFLHELGHALHFGYTDPELDFESKYLGDNSVTEAYAMFLDHLVFDRNWLEAFLDVEDPAELLRFMHLKQLYMLRRYAAKLDYELILHDGTPLEGKDAVYAEKLTEATMVPYPRANYLDDLDMGFYCARYLRAWMLQAQIHRHMRNTFGEGWFRDRRAGKALVELFRLGQKHSGDDIARELGYGGIELGPLLNGIREVLG